MIQHKGGLQHHDALPVVCYFRHIQSYSSCSVELIVNKVKCTAANEEIYCRYYLNITKFSSIRTLERKIKTNLKVGPMFFQVQ